MLKRFGNLIFANLVIISFYAIIYSQLNSDHFTGLDKNSKFIDYLYFSSTTFSSTGYGDISPKTNVAKIISMSQQVLLLIGIVSFFFSNEPETDFTVQIPSIQ